MKRLRFALGLVVVAMDCGPITPLPGSSAPKNACPDNPCEAYMQGGARPVCNGGACIVAEPVGAFALVVSLPSDSYFAPDRTFASSFADLLQSSTASDACPSGLCAQLPDVGGPLGVYSVLPSVAQQLNFALNPPAPWGVLTTLPVVVTYRPLWPLNQPSSTMEAATAGLPLDSIQATSIANAALLVPGPAMTEGLQFQTYLQNGYYERTVAPQPPFDRVFPPDVRIVDVDVLDPGQRTLENDEMQIDNTMNAQGKTIPTFDLIRAAGLDGWSALLRDRTSKRPVSNVVPLSGTTAAGVVLATNHVAPGLDALTNAQLVFAPPVGQPVPTAFFDPTASQLRRQETYPPIPAPATIKGTLVGKDGTTPVEADLDFEATGIDVVVATGFQLYMTNFEYTGHASARRNSAGLSMYSTLLPRGQYRVTIRPIEETPSEASVPGPGITVVENFVVPPQGNPIAMPDQEVDLQQIVQGTATVSDGRPLSEAIVEAVPVQCSLSTAAGCLPRAGRTTTGIDGSFSMVLDEGEYVLRVEPVEGTMLPWMWTVIVVGPTPAAVPPSFQVPAPVYAGLTLHDPQDNPIVNAVVRLFQVSAATGTSAGAGTSTGTSPTGASVSPGAVLPAVEIGRAITDATGHYDMYIAPSTQ